MRLKIKQLRGIIPSRAYPTDSGLDLCAVYGGTLLPGDTAKIPTGVAIELPEGFEAQVRPRSSFSARGLIVPLGTIDQSYRGEIGVVIFNLSHKTVVITPGDRIAQLVVCPVAYPEIEVVDELTPSDRGCCGFGSTGR